MTRVLIVEDVHRGHDPLAVYLRRERGVMFDSAPTIPEAMRLLDATLSPDICVLCARQFAQDQARALMAKLAAAPLALAMSQAALWSARGALRAGAAGVVLRQDTPRTIVRGLRFMVSGERYVPASLVALDPPVGELNLSMREAQVLESLCMGLTNKEIALSLEVQEVTVKLHVKAAFRKLGARNRTHAAMIARDLGLA